MSTTSTIVNEITVIGRVKRRLVDKAAKLWQRISYWTHARDVEFDDGKTAQDKVGNINGITSDAILENDDIASSIKPVHDVTIKTDNIKDNLDKGIINDHIQLIIDADGNLGWKKDGADTVIPFSSGYEFTDNIVLTAPEPGSDVNALNYSQIIFPIDKVKKVSFKIVTKTYYGEFYIRLRNKDGYYTDYLHQSMQTTITNKFFSIDTSQYDRIQFYISGHGGAPSTVVISSFTTSSQ